MAPQNSPSRWKWIEKALMEENYVIENAFNNDVFDATWWFIVNGEKWIWWICGLALMNKKEVIAYAIRLKEVEELQKLLDKC